MNKSADVVSRECGGVGVRVLLVAVSLIAIAAAIGVMMKSSQGMQEKSHRKAEQISLFGMQAALEKLYLEPGWTAGFDNVPYSDGSYSAALTQSTQGDTTILSVKALGTFRKTTDVKECLLYRLPGDSLWTSRGIR